MDTQAGSRSAAPPATAEPEHAPDSLGHVVSSPASMLSDFMQMTAYDWRMTVEHAKLTETREAIAHGVGSRIRTARQTRGVTRADFCKLLQVHENTLGKMERGDSLPDAAQLMQIAALTGRPIIWLLGGPDSSNGAGGPQSQEVPNSLEAVEVGGMVYVPLFDLRAAAGGGMFNDEEQVLHMRAFAADYIRRELHILHSRLAMVTVVGNSMEPDIHSGDVVLVDRKDKDISVEGPHLVRIDGGLLVKMVQRRPGGILRIASKNEQYAAFDINVMSEHLQDFEVLGRVRWAGVTFR